MLYQIQIIGYTCLVDLSHYTLIGSPNPIKQTWTKLFRVT